MRLDTTPRYAEFFCGGGMVRAALHGSWICGLANDIDAMKCESYAENWGDQNLFHCDIADLPEDSLRSDFGMFWASSPCQDFSLAGKGAGLAGTRSGVFSTWVKKITPAIRAGYAPRIIAFENVVGLVSRHNGTDFTSVLRTLIGLGYRVGALEIDARHFLPQSRPRVFVIAAREDLDTNPMTTVAPTEPFHTSRLRRYLASSPRDVRSSWLWWYLPTPSKPNTTIEEYLDGDVGQDWLKPREVRRLLAMMSEPSANRVQAAKAKESRTVGTLYKRGRPATGGGTEQRAEVRFDGLAGCLRTPAGGSSRQTVVVVEEGDVRARLLTAREAVRLMGLPDTYSLPPRYNDGYKIAGDGVVVPIVQHLDEALFQPLLGLPASRAVA